MPNSASVSLSVMKSFATILMLGQIAEEFHEISGLEESQLKWKGKGKKESPVFLGWFLLGFWMVFGTSVWYFV